MSDVQIDLARPAVAATAPSGLGVKVEALPLRGMITLRGDFDDAGFAQAVSEISGAEIPALRKATVNGDTGLLWMSPDELMAFVPYAEANAAVARFDEAIGDGHALAVNVSDARAIFRISGEKARQVLAKGAPVDLSPDAFGPGEVRRTRVGLVAAAFWMTDDESFELVCFRSYADYMWRWLCSAADADSLDDL